MTKLQEEILELDEYSQKDKYLTFFLGKNEYGLEIKYVTEIVVIQRITEIAETKEYVKGIINLRGKVIPVIDMRLMLGKEETEYTGRTCTVVLDINDVSVGLIIDSVTEVLTIAEEDIVPPPKLMTLNQIKYIKGIGKVGSNVKLLLDCEKLLVNNEIEYIIDSVLTK